MKGHASQIFLNWKLGQTMLLSSREDGHNGWLCPLHSLRGLMVHYSLGIGLPSLKIAYLHHWFSHNGIEWKLFNVTLEHIYTICAINNAFKWFFSQDFIFYIISETMSLRAMHLWFVKTGNLVKEEIHSRI